MLANVNPCPSLKTIHFEGQMLPQWAQLLDLAATLAKTPPETCGWFARFTHCSGVDDSRTIVEQCTLLRARLAKTKSAIAAELKRTRGDAQPGQILAAWEYTLETILQEAPLRKTCSWLIDTAEPDRIDAPANISLRRI